MKLSKNKVAGGVLGLLAIVSIVNTQAIVSLTNYVRGDSSNGMSLDGSNQSAQVVNFSTKTTENAVYKRGDKSDVILQVQKALTSKGLYKGDISGLMGPRTEKAISDFQKSNGLTVTGTLDQKTINLILNRGAGDSRDGGWNPGLSVIGSAPTLSYLQGRCNGEPQPFVRILSPWIGDQFTYLEDDVDIQIFVCDNTATSSTNTHIIEGLVSQGIDIENNAAIEGSLELVAAAFDDSDMIPYGENSWLINYTLEDDHFEPGHYAMVISSEGGYKINGTPQFGTNVYAGWVGPFEIVGGGDGDGLVSTECNAQLLYPHPGQTYTLEENSNGTGYVVDVNVFLYINQNLYNADCAWDTSGITFPVEGNNPPGGSAGLVSWDGGLTGYPLWIHGDNMYHQSLSFSPNNPNTPEGPYTLTVLDGEGHQIEVPINIQY